MYVRAITVHIIFSGWNVSQNIIFKYKYKDIYPQEIDTAISADLYLPQLYTHVTTFTPNKHNDSLANSKI